MPILRLQTCNVCKFVFKTQYDLTEHTKISKNCSPVSIINSQERIFNYIFIEM